MIQKPGKTWGRDVTALEDDLTSNQLLQNTRTSVKRDKPRQGVSVKEDKEDTWSHLSSGWKKVGGWKVSLKIYIYKPELTWVTARIYTTSIMGRIQSLKFSLNLVFTFHKQKKIIFRGKQLKTGPQKNSYRLCSIKHVFTENKNNRHRKTANIRIIRWVA